MKNTILKFENPFMDDFSMKLPKNSQILSVFLRQGQNPIVCLCVLATPENEMEERHFSIFANGYSLPDDGIERKHIASFPLYNAVLGFHVFEKIGH